jgi:hypothetical protein
MQDSKKQSSDSGVVDSDATSKETLADLEDEQSPDSESEGTASESEAPSPDGADVSPNKTDDSGPM